MKDQSYLSEKNSEKPSIDLIKETTLFKTQNPQKQRSNTSFNPFRNEEFSEIIPRSPDKQIENKISYAKRELKNKESMSFSNSDFLDYMSEKNNQLSSFLIPENNDSADFIIRKYKRHIQNINSSLKSSNHTQKFENIVHCMKCEEFYFSSKIQNHICEDRKARSQKTKIRRIISIFKEILQICISKEKSEKFLAELAIYHIITSSLTCNIHQIDEYINDAKALILKTNADFRTISQKAIEMLENIKEEKSYLSISSISRPFIEKEFYDLFMQCKMKLPIESQKREITAHDAFQKAKRSDIPRCRWKDFIQEILKN